MPRVRKTYAEMLAEIKQALEAGPLSHEEILGKIDPQTVKILPQAVRQKDIAGQVKTRPNGQPMILMYSLVGGE